MARSATARRHRAVRRSTVVPAARPTAVPRLRLGLAALLALLVLGAVVLARVLTGALAVNQGGSAAVPLAILRTGDFHALAFSPTEPDVVFFGHHNGVMRSQDGGRTWQPLVERRNFDAMGLAINHQNPREVYLAGHDVFQMSADGGATWQPVQHDLPGTDIHGFAMSPDDPSRLYAFVNGIGLFASADGARTWQRLGPVPPDIMSVAAAGGDPETVYVASMGSGVLRSDDGGRTWAPATSRPGSGRVLTVAVHPAARQTVYAGTEHGLYKSTDGGSTWTKLPFPGANAVAVAISPAQPERVLAVYQDTRGEKGEVYRSDDGGKTWGAKQ